METGWREENERSGTAIMVSLDQDDKARGVVFKNPLFLKAGIADIETFAVQDAPVSRNRKWLDSNARCISIVMGVLSLCLFIILPVLVMISPRVPSIGAPKVKSFSLVFYSGIFQSLLTRSIVSRQTRKRLERHHTLWKLFLFLTTCSIAFRPEATPALPKPPERSVERTLNHGNCSMLENIPENVVQFANSKQKERRHMLYDTSCDFGMPLVFKYDSATLGAMEILYNAMKSTPFADDMASNEGCTKIVLKMMTFLVFNPCQDDCTRAQFICDEQCVKIQTKCPELKEIPYVNADGAINTYRAAMNAFLSGEFDNIQNKDENDREKWMEQSVKYIGVILNNNYMPKCREKQEVDKISGASCFFFDGTIYHSKLRPEGEKVIDGPNCSMARMYDVEEENKRRIIDRAQEGGDLFTGQQDIQQLSPFDYLIMSAFYMYGCSSLFLWSNTSAKLALKERFPHPETDGDPDPIFRLSTRSIAHLVFLGSIGCLFGCLVFYVGFLRVEEAFRYEWEIGLSWIYFMLGGSTVIAFTSGMQTIVSALVNQQGEIVDQNEEAKKNKKRQKGGMLLCSDMVFIRLLKMYRYHTRPRGGKWFFTKMMFWECFEMLLQTVSLHQFATEKPQEYVILSSSLLLINMIASPILFYKSATATAKNVTSYNGIMLTVDTLIDIMFFGLNLYYIEAENLRTNAFVGSAALAWPIFCVVMRLRSLARLILVRYSNSVLHGGQSLSEASSEQKALDRRKRQVVVVMVMLCAVAAFTLLQFIFAVSSSVFINAKCAAELGQHLWNGARPKYTFKHGVFGAPDCAYETIEEIHAPGKEISMISGHIGKCKKLAVLNLTNNAIADVPRELLMIGGELHTVDLRGNPVHSVLEARNMSLYGGIPPFIIRHLNASLEKLDLSNNHLNRVPESIGKFKKLTSLNLDHNHLGPESLPWEIVTLSSLHWFSMKGNRLETHVNWSNQGGFQSNKYLNKAGKYVNEAAVEFLKRHFNASLTHLNVSKNGFEIDQYNYAVNNFNGLISLDISFNKKLRTSIHAPLKGISKLTKLKFMSIEGNTGITSIHSDEIEDMEKRTTENITEFNIRNIGLANLVISGCENRNESCVEEINDCPNVTCLKHLGATRNYPRTMMKQLRPNIKSIMIRNFIWEGFRLSDICDFMNLGMFRWDFTESYEGIKKTEFPRCVVEMKTLKSLLLSRTGTSPPPPKLAFLPPFTQFHYVLNTYTHGDNVTFPLVKIPSNRSLVNFRLANFVPPVPPEYGTFPILRIKIMPKKPFKIPVEWKSFDVIQVSGARPNDVTGSISHLTVEKLALFDDTNVTGPLFRVGQNFQCMRLDGKNDSLEYFQDMWNVSCAKANNALFEDKNTRLGDDASNVSNVINCTLPTTSSTALHVFCANTKKGRWNCFEERFFKTGVECQSMYVSGKVREETEAEQCT